MRLIDLWIEWNERRIKPEKFCIEFKNHFNKEIQEELARRFELNKIVSKKIMQEKGEEARFCVNCKKVLTKHQKSFCSRNCKWEYEKSYIPEREIKKLKGEKTK